MKRMLLFGFIALVALISSCKKDDKPEDPKPEELIVGRWKASSAFVGTLDLLVPTSTMKNELEIEFLANKSVVFYRKSLIPVVYESTLNGVYSLDGDKITMTASVGADSKTVTGPLDITASHFLFTATSGDTTEFYSRIDATKL